ncbi:MAG: hypothetical protein U0324_35395 [Polyangiales bacterium]
MGFDARRLLPWGAIVWFGCSSTSAPPSPADAAAEAPVGLDVADDAAATRCASDRECSARGQVCSAAAGVCVECNTAADCGDGRACLGSRCAVVTPCTSSRMCPGQVCSTRLGHCVDCEQDVDCTGGQVCRANVCAAPPRPCRSSRECSDINQVCAATRGHCVDCVADSDCAPGSYCGPELACLARACVPNSSSCVSATRARLCNAVGSAAREVDCPAGQTCRGNVCQAPVCAPGQASCDPATGARRRCAEDGGGYVPMPCAAEESCRDGGCVARACAPGSATCASATERRVCAVDGLTTSVVACASGEGCREGVCVPRTCVPGAATCTSTTARLVCNADGFGTTPMPCTASQRCTSGSCVDLACTPGTSTCISGSTVRVCNAEGTATMDVPCPSSSTCTGTTCSSWVCTPGSATCPAGMTARTVCAADGLRTNSDPCVAPANASAPRCGADNACTFTCNAGFGDCNLLAADGCEVTLATNVSHCGRCGAACAPRAGMTVACVAGVCEYRCPTGQALCGSVCVDTQADPMNCGACGTRCAAGQYCVRGACGAMPPLYHGWTCPIPGCLTTTYNTMAPTNQGGQYPYIMGDSNGCRAWKLAATVCTTQPTLYNDRDNWQCPMAGGFTDPVFGTFCPVANQYACSTCPGACNATCLYTPLSLRNCMGSERAQP